MENERHVEELRQHGQQRNRAGEKQSAYRGILVAGKNIDEPEDGQDKDADRPMREEEDPVHVAQVPEELVPPDARRYSSHVTIVILVG